MRGECHIALWDFNILNIQYCGQYTFVTNCNTYSLQRIAVIEIRLVVTPSILQIW
jgi:hypothetical protein